MTTQEAMDYLGLTTDGYLRKLNKDGVIRRIATNVWDADSIVAYKKLRRGKRGGKYDRDEQGNRLPDGSVDHSIMTSREAAEYLGISVELLNYCEQLGKIRKIQYGRWRFTSVRRLSKLKSFKTIQQKVLSTQEAIAILGSRDKLNRRARKGDAIRLARGVWDAESIHACRNN